MNQKYKDDLLQDGQNEDATMSVALEQRVRTALASESVASADLAALQEEVDLTIAAMEIEQKKGHEHAAFVRDRLLRLKPCLEQRLQEVQAEEDLTYWHADHDVIKANRDELAAELRELYPPVAAKIADLFSRLRAFDAELSRLHQARPAGVSEHLLSPELVARGIESFTINSRSLIDEVKLPAFEPGQSQVWPPPRQFDPSVFALVPHGRRYSADWGLAAEEQARAMRERHEREINEEAARAAQRAAGPGGIQGFVDRDRHVSAAGGPDRRAERHRGGVAGIGPTGAGNGPTDQG